ncbi:hypothetical protein BH10ACI2_BH10ACI2_07510 [soil metagenome]
MESLRDKILKLTEPERIKIANALYESLAAEPDYKLALTPEQRMDFERKTEEMRRKIESTDFH